MKTLQKLLWKNDLKVDALPDVYMVTGTVKADVNISQNECDLIKL